MGFNTVNYAISKKETSDAVTSALTGVLSIEVDDTKGELIIKMNDGTTLSLTPPTTPGKSLEYSWNGTRLGVRVEGDASYTYTDLKGETGSIANADLTVDGENIYITSDGVKQGGGVDLNADVLVGLSVNKATEDHYLEYDGKRVDIAGTNTANNSDIDDIF